MTSEKKIKFVLSEKENEIENIYNFNVTAFADSQDFAWTKENIKNEIKSGWHLYSAIIDKDIICAIFMKIDSGKLLTKNTPIKIDYQGNGFSHIIKEFYEQYASENKINEVVNYCPNDNFRMISLNEGHGYAKTGNIVGPNKNIIEWHKKL